MRHLKIDSEAQLPPLTAIRIGFAERAAGIFQAYDSWPASAPPKILTKSSVTPKGLAYKYLNFCNLVVG